MASLLVISLLIFNGYANNPSSDRGFEISGAYTDSIASTKNVNLVIRDATHSQQEILEKYNLEK